MLMIICFRRDMGNKLAILREELMLNEDQRKIIIALEKEENDTKRLIGMKLGDMEEDIVSAVHSKYKIIEDKLDSSITKWIEVETNQQEIFRQQQKTLDSIIKGSGNDII